MTDTDDPIFIERLQAGDQAAFAELVEAHSPPIYYLALRMLGDETEAEDVLQDTFLSAFKSIDSFEGRASLSTWLHRIATNAALMRLRKLRPTFLSVDAVADQNNSDMVPPALFDWCCLPESELLSSEARAEMRRAVEALPDSLRVVFMLRDVEGFSTQETADALDLSVSAVKSRLMRARMALREQLTHYFSGRVSTNTETTR